MSGVPVSVTIQPRDRFSNAVVNASTADISLLHNSEILRAPGVLSSSGNEFQAVFHLFRAGEWVVGAAVDGVTLTATKRVTVMPIDGTWLFLFERSDLKDRVHLFQVVVSDSIPRISSLPSYHWSGARVNSFTSATTVGSVLSPDSVRWSLDLQNGELAELQYRVAADTATGSIAINGQSYRATGVRIDPALLARPHQTQSAPTDAKPIILLRLDDIPPTDRALLTNLHERGLVAEISVPTRWVGVEDRLTWSELREWAARGFGIAAHSRMHLTAQPSAADFVSEVAGSLSDLANEGLQSTIFVQPGTWLDSAYFNRRDKLATWRGSLLRTFTDAFEGYVYPGMTTRPAADTMAYGMGHVTVTDGVTPDYILRQWATAQQPYRVTTFLFHTFRLAAPDTMNWLLDSLSVAQREGRVRIIPRSSDFFPR